MNRRVIVALLCVGLTIILSLGGVGLYKIHTLKLQTQDLLNAKLVAFASQSSNEALNVSYKPFECSGLVFIECKSEEISLQSSLFEERVLGFRNLTLKADEIDFKSLAFLVSSEVVAPQIGGVEEYIQALFPHQLNLRLKLSVESEESYKVDARFLLEAKNIDYQEEFNATIFSPELKSKGFLSSIQNPDFLNEKIELKNMILSLNSKNLSEAIYQIVKGKYGGLGKKEYRGLANLMIGASMMQFEGNKEIQEMIAGAGALALGDAKRMNIYISAKNGVIDPQELIDGDTNQILQVLFEKYDFETRLEK